MKDLWSGSQRDLSLRLALCVLSHSGALSKTLGTGTQLSHLKIEVLLDQWFSLVTPSNHLGSY